LIWSSFFEKLVEKEETEAWLKKRKKAADFSFGPQEWCARERHS
jgi:hypothetical protein